MWFTAVDIASTPGGHAGMQRSQPLQWSTSMVTVPRLLISFVFELGMRRTPLPRRVLVRGKEIPTGEERALVRLDERCLLDDAGDTRVRAEHHYRTAEGIAEVGCDRGCGQSDERDRRGHLDLERRVVHEHETVGPQLGFER